MMTEDYKSIDFPNFSEKRHRKADYYFSEGEINADKYGEDELIEMLKGNDIYQQYEALGAVGKRKLAKALPQLQTIALYDEDVNLQREAICTIRRIGRKAALDILRFLKTTEHKDFIEEILKDGALKFWNPRS